MKVGILHHDLEWSEQQFKKYLEESGQKVQLYDIRNTTVDKLVKNDLVLNRVYASVANRDYESIKKTLEVLRELEIRNVKCINSLETSLADYSKLFAYKIMKDKKILTPRTIPYQEEMDLNEIINTYQSPFIIKRDRGGRGKNIRKCNSKKDLENAILKIKEEKSYKGKILIQEFEKPIENFDYRVWVINNNALFYHKRTLISLKKDETPWLASRSLGSKILPIKTKIPQDLKLFSEDCAKAIGASLDVLDIIKTNKGYCVIEHNPTPNFRPEYEEILGFNPIKYLINEILRT